MGGHLLFLYNEHYALFYGIITTTVLDPLGDPEAAPAVVDDGSAEVDPGADAPVADPDPDPEVEADADAGWGLPT